MQARSHAKAAGDAIRKNSAVSIRWAGDRCKDRCHSYEAQASDKARVRSGKAQIVLRAAQATADDQNVESHHRNHAECNYVLHCCYLTCLLKKES